MTLKISVIGTGYLGATHAAAMAEAERLKPIANGAYWRNKILARQPAIDAIRPTLAD